MQKNSKKHLVKKETFCLKENNENDEDEHLPRLVWACYLSPALDLVFQP